MKNTPVIAYILLGSILTLLVILSFAFDKKEESKTANKVNEIQKWKAPSLPSSISFAGEAVPLNRWDVKEQLDREVLLNYYWQNNIFYMLKLSERCFPMIEERLKAHGVPDDFKYLCVAESNLTNATSRVGAVGFWQFMKTTAPGYNIEVSATVDERYNVLKSTDAACRYLKDAYAKFGNWTAAAAAYNCGLGGYNSRAVFQKTNYYYDLVLPEETQRYIFRILAFKYLLANADSLGFQLPEEERYKPVKTRSIFVKSGISDLNRFAIENGSTYKMLKWFNPWLRERHLQVKPGKTYEIILPENN